MTLRRSKETQVFQLVATLLVIHRALGNETLGDRLIQAVFNGYEKDVRPICGPYPGAVVPNLGIAIRQLIELNNPEQKLTTSTWFRTKWNDCRLNWEPSDYDGVSTISVPRTRMWIPDLTLYENAESKLGEQDEYLVSIRHDGLIEYNLPAVVKSMCKLNVALFPFDHQTCYLTLGSWIYGDNDVNFTARANNPADLTSYIPHGEWDLQRLDVKDQTLDGFDGTGYSQVVFTLHLRRKALFHTVNLILPSVLVKSLAIVGFLLPPESGEKLNLEITVLLSLLVFQLVILNSMPHSSNHLPVIAIYFLMSMILIALSCVCTVVVLNVHYNKHHTPLPAWIRQILTGRLGRLFHLDELMYNTHEKLQRLRNENKQRGHKQNTPLEPSSSHTAPAYSQKSSGKVSNGLDRLSLRARRPREPEDDSVYGFHPSTAYNYHAPDPYSQRYPSSKQPGSRPTTTSFFSVTTPDLQPSTSEPQPGDSTVVAVTREILAHLERKTTGGIKKQISELVETQWKLFAVFLDRLFLFTFLTMGFVIGTAVFSYISS